jgi:hypothetical protein
MNDRHDCPDGQSSTTAKSTRFPGFSREKLAAFEACDAALDHLRIVQPQDGTPVEIWAAVSLSRLPPRLKALLLILEEDGTEPTPDGLVPWKTFEQIRQRLPNDKAGERKAGSVRQLISRLREEFIERGLNPNLVQRMPVPGQVGEKQDRRWHARLRVRSACTAAATRAAAAAATTSGTKQKG